MAVYSAVCRQTGGAIFDVCSASRCLFEDEADEYPERMGADAHDLDRLGDEGRSS